MTEGQIEHANKHFEFVYISLQKKNTNLLWGQIEHAKLQENHEIETNFRDKK